MAQAKQPKDKPLIVVTMEGGLIQNVDAIGAVKADVVVIDFDTEGSDPSELTQIGRKRSDLAYVSFYAAPHGRPHNAKRIREVARD